MDRLIVLGEAILKEISAKISFQEFRHSVGMTDSSPAIHRRVGWRNGKRPVGTLDWPLTEGFRPSRWDGQISLGDYPAINRRATFKCPSGTAIPLLIGVLQRSLKGWPSFSPELNQSTNVETASTLSGLSVSQPTQGRRWCANPGLNDCNPVGVAANNRHSCEQTLIRQTRRHPSP